jgi:hypothetical protein
MAAFRVKNLMVSFLPQEGRIARLPGGGGGGSGDGFGPCGACTCTFGCSCCSLATCGCTCTQCTQGCTVCSGCSGPCSAGCTCSCSCSCTGGCSGATIGLTLACGLEDPRRLDELSVLKEQLRRAMAQVEEQERVLEERMRPQTLEEVNRLEQEMSAALEELRIRRAELEKGTSKGNDDQRKY